jgi:hypothetical protein
VYKAVLRLFKGSQAHQDVVGRIYVNVVPQKTPVPYIRIVPGRTPEYSKDGQGSEIHELTVDIFALTYRECDEIARNVETALDFQNYTWTDVKISNITMTDELSIYENEWELHRIIQTYQIRVK